MNSECSVPTPNAKPVHKESGTSMSLKEAYEKKMQAQLDEWIAEIDTLKAKADKAEANAQIDYYKRVESLKKNESALRQKLSELKEASDDAWEDLKSGINDAWDSFGNAIKSATERFK